MRFTALEVPYFARTLAGCMYGSSDPAADVPVLVEHVRAGRLDLGAMITHRLPLDSVEEAFRRLEARNGAGPCWSWTSRAGPARRR